MDTVTEKLTSVTMVGILLMSALTLVAFTGPGMAQTANAGNAAGNTAVSFSDQSTDGTAVTVDSVNVSEGGFVAIHNESLFDGDAVGSVVGVSGYLEPGLHENVTVTLFDVPGASFDEDELTESQNLIAMPHRDTDGDETYGFVATDGTADGPYLDAGQAVTDSANVTVVGQTTSESFTVRDLSVPMVVERGSNQTVNATVTNPNNVVETQTVTFRVDGDVAAREQVTLGPDESTTVDYPLNTTVAEGTYFLGVYTQTRGQPAQVRIVEEIESFGVANLSAPASATAGDTVSVNATITNPNAFALAQSVEFRFSGNQLAERTVTLAANDSTEVSFSADTAGIEPGSYIHSVFTVARGQSALITLTTTSPTTTESATVSVSDQSTDGETVTVDSVNVSEGGFVAIHNESLFDGDAVGSVVGVSDYLEPGLHENVTIGLFDVPGASFDEDELTENQSLIAMPHLDTDGDETYGFVATDGAADGPYLDAGQAVTDSANVTVSDDSQGTSLPLPDNESTATGTS
ncbi:DUF7282 domain-containing protein [Haloarcula sp. GH36]|uniref:DUF7282 domain-containing protein n=1 Tax=Haloarcula montana TaxID=3111776 RepID=UPI002D774670|nr:CARDB domain-containing protein [Haloarcula sp. GH36]